MTRSDRPSLESLVPLMMIEEDIVIEQQNEVTCEPAKEILRHFESGDVVLVQVDSQCLPAIVCNISGLVMKFDIDRQLYHVYLLNKEFTEQWIDAMDMVIYSVPMIVECENEQLMSMWSTANELLKISNDGEEKARLEEFRTRFNEVRQQQLPLSLSINSNKSSRRSRNSSRKSTSQPILECSLTPCEELHIIESVYQLSPCTYTDAKRIAEETYLKIISTNNRENHSFYSVDNLPEQWFITFVIRYINYFRKYSSVWLPDLETMRENYENTNKLYSLISLLKETV